MMAFTKSAAVLATLAGTMVASGGQDQLDRYRTQMANMSPSGVAAPADGAIASAIAQWRALQIGRAHV